MAGCVDDGLLAAFLEGSTLGDPEREALQAHLAGCVECRRVLAESAMTLAPAELARGTQVGRYLILQFVGAGAMGVVYAAYDPELDRKVALKLLRDRGGAAGLTARLQREAQAMARLSHPHVITVHDVGEEADQLFVAMEFVDGETLSHWLDGQRSLDQILAVFVAAGQGLRAAHEAGLVHRDFKPDNVLVGRDGRVRVTDFGLARALGESHEADVGNGASAPGSPLHTSLTGTGALVGTPAYMSPEQMRGAPADARADQFSFCAALWEALYGERPFSAPSLEALRDQIEGGRVREPPRGSKVPARIRRALQRGLLAKPEDRHRSMGELLAELAHDPGARRRSLTVGVTALALAGLAVGGWWSSRAPACRGAERKLDGVWDAGRRASLERVMTASGKPYAGATFAAAARLLDQFGGAFVSEHTAACEESRRGEQSAELLDLRMQCLDGRLRETRALVDILSEPGSETVDRAVEAVSALTPVAVCDKALVGARVRPPADAATRAKVLALDEQLDRARAQLRAGRYAPARDRAKAIAEQAVALKYRPLEAQARALQGELEDRLGDPKTAESLLSGALAAAQAGRDDATSVAVLAELARVTGYRRAATDAGLRWLELARGLIERMGGDVRLEAAVASGAAVVEQAAGRYPEALAHAEHALSLRQKSLGDDHPDVAEALSSVGFILRDMGQYDRARRTLERALALREKLLGADHPQVAVTLNQLGGTCRRLALLEDAERYHLRALAIVERALGPDHIEAGYALNSLGNVYALQNHWDRALASYRRALASGEKTLGAVHPEVAMAHSNIGWALRWLGRYPEAEVELRRALALLEPKVDSDHPYLAEVMTNLAAVRRMRGDFVESQKLDGRALAAAERKLGPQHPQLADPLNGLGLTALGRGDPLAAIDPLERALALRLTAKASRLELSETRFALGRALYAARKDRARARSLVEEARRGYQGGSRPGELAAVDAWLAVNR